MGSYFFSNRVFSRPWQLTRHFGTSDSPYHRSFRFRLRRIRHDYQNVLVLADSKKLLVTAVELIQFPRIKKSEAFWQILTKRIKKTLFHLQPNVLARLATCFDVHRRDIGGVLGEIAEKLVMDGDGFTGTVDGPSAVILCDVLSRRLPDWQRPRRLFEYLSAHALNGMYALSLDELATFLNAIARVNHPNNAILDRDVLDSAFFAKVKTALDDNSVIEPHTLASLSQVFAKHNCTDQKLFSLLVRCCVNTAEEERFAPEELFRCIEGLHNASIEGLNKLELVGALHGAICTMLPHYSKRKLLLLQEFVQHNDDSSEKNTQLLLRQALRDVGLV